MTTRAPLDDHPLVRALDGVSELIDDVAGLDPTYVPTREKLRALRSTDRLIARLEGLRLDLLSASSDVADAAGARSAGVWLGVESRVHCWSTSRPICCPVAAERRRRWR